MFLTILDVKIPRHDDQANPGPLRDTTAIAVAIAMPHGSRRAGLQGRRRGSVTVLAQPSERSTVCQDHYSGTGEAEEAGKP